MEASFATGLAAAGALLVRRARHKAACAREVAREPPRWPSAELAEPGTQRAGLRDSGPAAHEAQQLPSTDLLAEPGTQRASLRDSGPAAHEPRWPSTDLLAEPGTQRASLRDSGPAAHEPRWPSTELLTEPGTQRASLRYSGPAAHEPRWPSTELLTEPGTPPLCERSSLRDSREEDSAALRRAVRKLHELSAILAHTPLTPVESERLSVVLAHLRHAHQLRVVLLEEQVRRTHAPISQTRTSLNAHLSPSRQGTTTHTHTRLLRKHARHQPVSKRKTPSLR